MGQLKLRYLKRFPNPNFKSHKWKTLDKCHALPLCSMQDCKTSKDKVEKKSNKKGKLLLEDQIGKLNFWSPSVKKMYHVSSPRIGQLTVKKD